MIKAELFSEIIYFGDTARVPYGIKDKNTITRYSLEALEFFKNFKIDILITACNTASAYALEDLKAAGFCDVVGVIEPGVLALQKRVASKSSNLLVIGTRATVNSGRYFSLLSDLGYKNIEQKATGLFVSMIEEGIFKGEVLDSVFNHYFKGIKKPDALILGCTHFPLIQDELSKYFGGIPLIHSGDAIVDYLIESYNLLPIYKNPKILYFASENPQGLKDVAEIWLNT